MGPNSYKVYGYRWVVLAVFMLVNLTIQILWIFYAPITGLIGVTYATAFWLLIASAFVMGFFMVSANPIGMHYAAEITCPTPEGASNGVISLAGQSAVVFVYIMEALKAPDGSFTPALLLCGGLLVICLMLVTQLKDAGQETTREPVYVTG